MIVGSVKSICCFTNLHPHIVNTLPLEPSTSCVTATGFLLFLFVLLLLLFLIFPCFFKFQLSSSFFVVPYHLPLSSFFLFVYFSRSRLPSLFVSLISFSLFCSIIILPLSFSSDVFFSLLCYRLYFLFLGPFVGALPDLLLYLFLSLFLFFSSVFFSLIIFLFSLKCTASCSSQSPSSSLSSSLSS